MPKMHCECGASYTFAESSLGKKAKCKKCGVVFVLEDEEGPIPLADDPRYPEDAPSTPEPTFTPNYDDAVRSVADQGQIVAPPGSPAAMGRADLPGHTFTDTAEEPRSYASNVLWTFLFPSSPGNLVKFGVVWAFVTVIPFVALIPLLGLILQILVIGWYAAFRLTIVASAASGDSELPDVNVSSDLVEDLIRPLFAWIGSWAVVFFPATAYLIAAWHMGWLPGINWMQAALGGAGSFWQWFSTGDLLLIILVCLGMAAWPITVLCIALGGFTEVYRVDLILLTIIRTFPAYLLTLALMGLAILVLVGLENLTANRLTPTPGAGPGPSLGSAIGMGILSTGVRVYLDIVLMRLIGLYYHHFKDRFAMSWG